MKALNYINISELFLFDFIRQKANGINIFGAKFEMADWTFPRSQKVIKHNIQPLHFFSIQECK